MKPLNSNTDPNSEQYKKNYKANLALVNELNEKLDQAQNQASDKAIQKFKKANKLLTRERIEKLLDPGSYFLEFSPLAAIDLPDQFTGASCVTGLGVVSGKQVIIFSSDPLVKGGAISPLSIEKYLRAQEIALENKLPCIHLVESAGANLNFAGEVFIPGGRIFRNITQASAQGIPQIGIVFGSSTAGGAYIPALCDYVVMVKNQARMYLGGPPLVKLATNEDVTDEDLGGADMHSSISGVSDYLAENDQEAIVLAREIVETLNITSKNETPDNIIPPAFDSDELLGIVSPDPRHPFDVREVLARILDGSALDEFKKEYGDTLVTGFAKLHGYPVGVIANNGILFSDSAKKACHFIELCNQRNTPIIYFSNVSGFMVGKEYEQGGIVKHGANMINAVANSRVPQFTVIIGGAHGAGYYAMCGRPFNPRYLITWPCSKTSIMGPEQGAGVLSIVRKASLAKEGKTLSAEEEEQFKEPIRQMFEAQCSPYHATAKLHDDGIIDPRLTRNALGIALSACQVTLKDKKNYGIFRF